MRSRLPLAGVLGAAAVAAVVLVPHDPAVLRDAVAAAGAWAPLLLLGAWVAGTPLLVPGTLLCAAGGLLLGPLGIGGRGVEERLPARVRAGHFVVAGGAAALAVAGLLLLRGVRRLPA